MNILFTGNYDIHYNRTHILREGLKEFHDLSIREYPISKRGEKSNDYNNSLDWADVVFLPPFAHKTVHLIKRKTKTPIVFDPLVSVYMSKVFDFQKYPKYSPRALKRFYIDYRAFHAADQIVFDTHEHLKYMSKTFRIKHNSLNVLHIGVNMKDFYPINTNNANHQYIIGFYGSFLPLQGVNKIIKAAKILSDQEDIVFDLVGTGWKMDEAQHEVNKWNLKNVKFSGWMDYFELNQKINSFDICLGVFGDSIKTDVVVPNKAYHYAACKKCMITKNTPGIREVFENEKNTVLTDGTPEDLAEKILFLKNNPVIKEKIASEAYQLIINHYNEKIIAGNFVKLIKEYLR